jgi:hypothetical protein
MTAGLSWDLVDDIRQLLSFHFMLNALRAGTIVAVVAGAIGYLMVLRRQSFAGHTLALIGFPGAAGATWLGLNTAFGYFGFCVAGALIIAALPGGGRRNAGLGGFSEESAGIGTVQAFALACGFLFVSLYNGGPVPLAARGLAAVFARVGPAGAVGPRLVRPRRRCGPRGRMCERGRSRTRSLGATGSSLPHRGT